MSRTRKRDTSSQNPVKVNITYKPNSGEFIVYNKDSKTRSESSSIDIIILDADRNSISGYSPEYDSPILCNSVVNTKKEPLTLGVIENGKYKEVVKGLYQDIKEELEGSKYTSDIFCLVVEGDDLLVANLQLVGTARSQFMDWYYENEDEALENIVTIGATEEVYNYVKKTNTIEEVSKTQQKKWRTTWFKKLTMSFTELTEEQGEIATEQDVNLQKYFGVSTPTKEITDSADQDAPEDAEDVGKDDLPF